MTDGNPRPDEELTPPASTRWSREAEHTEEELAPPFVPGGARGSASEAQAEPEDETGAGEEGSAFPFEAGWDAAEEEDEESVGAGDDFPFEAFDIEGGEPAETPEATGDAVPEDIGAEPDAWAQVLPAAAEEEQEDEDGPWAEAALTEEPTAEPMDPWAEAPPIAGEAAEADEDWEAPWAETPAGEAEPETATESGPAGAHELADRLEKMARRLRDEGAGAAEAEMSSPDRFTALLAGLLAGYLAGRK